MIALVHCSPGKCSLPGAPLEFESDGTLATEGMREGIRGLDRSSFFGGTGSDVIYDMIVREDGSVYLAGATSSLDLPDLDTSGRKRGDDGFVVLVSPDGRSITKGVFLGGSGDFDSVRALYLDGDTLYAVGSTNSSDFPTTSDAFQRQYRGAFDGFLVALQPDDLSVEYSTYIGETGGDSVSGIAVTRTGEILIAGLTSSTEFPLAEGACRSDGDVFVAKVAASLDRVDFARCVGGTDEDSPRAIAYDKDSDFVVVVGVTRSVDLGVERAFQPNHGGSESDAFVTVLDAGSGEIRSTSYLGGSGIDQAWGLTVAEGGAVYVVGSTDSADFPTNGHPSGTGILPAYAGFVSRFTIAPDGSVLLADSRLLGGASSLFGSGALDVALDDTSGNVVIVGTTDSADFPVQGALQAGFQGVSDAFVTELSHDLAEIRFSTLLGGGSIDTPYTVGVRDGAIYVAGVTASLDFPVINSFQGRPYGGDAFIARIVRGETASMCAYVASGGSLAVFDASRRHIAGILAEDALSIRVGALALAPDASRAYVLERFRSATAAVASVGEVPTGSVAAVNTTTGVVERRFGALNDPRDLLVTADGERVVATDANGVRVYDARTGSRVCELSLAGASQLAAVPESDAAYVLSDDGSALYVVDPCDGSAIISLTLDPGSVGVNVQVASSEQLVLIVDFARSAVGAYDSHSGELEWSVAVGPGARGIAITPDERLAFVSHQYLGLGAVTVVSLGERRVVALLSLDHGIDDLGITPDGTFLYIASGLAQTIWVVDIATLQTIEIIPLGGAGALVLGAKRGGCRIRRACVGDCNGDGEVRIDELVTEVAISLGTVGKEECPALGDLDVVSIDYLVGAVRASLAGCPVEP